MIIRILLAFSTYFFLSEIYAQKMFLSIDYPDTTISYKLYYKDTDSLKNDKLKAYFAEDTAMLAYEKNYYYGKQNGIYKEYYPSGSTYILSIYQQGKIHGDWTKYDELGKVQVKAKYLNGIKHGFYINLKEKYQGRYRNGKRHGKWEFNLNSYAYYKRFYENGELIDKRKISLNPLPALSGITQSSKNETDERIEAEVVQVWEEKKYDTIKIEYPDSTVQYSVRYINRDSIQHPTMRKAVYRDSQNNTALIKYIYGGKLSGNYKIYYPNGQLYRHWFYNYGLLNGDFYEYRINGKLKTKGKYRSGKKYGKWEYNLGTKEYYKEKYKDGELEEK